MSKSSVMVFDLVTIFLDLVTFPMDFVINFVTFNFDLVTSFFDIHYYNIRELYFLKGAQENGSVEISWGKIGNDNSLMYTAERMFE